MTMKAHTYYIIFGRPPTGGKLPLFPPGGATVYAFQRLRLNTRYSLVIQ